jgi:predicted AAA+ superfamily ATPase
MVGKSTLLGNMRSDNWDIRYVNMLDPHTHKSAEDPVRFFEENKPPVIIDEIHKKPDLISHIKDRIAENPASGQYFLIGVMGMELVKIYQDALGGHAGLLRLLGLSLRELAQVEYRKPFLPTPGHVDGMRSALRGDATLRTMIHRGFFPALYGNDSRPQIWADFYDFYFRFLIKKVSGKLLASQDVPVFIQFVKAIALYTGQILDTPAIAQSCGLDAETAYYWLLQLEEVGLVYLLKSYRDKHNKRLIDMPKLYFLDTGLACWLLSLNTPKEMTQSALWGRIFESFAVVEVIKSYYNDGIIEPPLCYYHDTDDNEIDLLIEDGDTLYPVEINTTSAPDKSMVSSLCCLEGITGKKVGSGALICLADDCQPLSDTVWALPARYI